MAGKLMEDKVCPNHPDRPAESRCTTCFKPLCHECIIVKGSLDFCSDQCATNHFTTNASIQDGLERDARARRRARIRKMILIIFLMVIGFACVAYWRSLPPERKKSLIEKGKQATRKARKAADEAKKKLSE